MKNSKKLTAMTALAVVAATVVPAVASADTVSFTDISGSYAAAAIQDLASQGILNGTGNGMFSPKANVTRQDFAIILAKALKLDVTNPPSTATFSDVPTTNYAFKYVEAVAKAGYIHGTGNGMFGYGANLTRQDMAIMLVNALGVNYAGAASNLNFTDNSAITYGQDQVGYAVKAGLVHGMGDGSFGPHGLATREMVAAIAENFLNVVKTQNLKLTASATSVKVGDKVTLTVSGTTDAVTWAVDNGGAISQDGTFVASAAGTYNVTATVDGVTLKQAITVVNNQVTVASVTALNLKQIAVTFSGAVDSTTATAAASYVYTGATTIDTVAGDNGIVLQPDNKTVIITLTGNEAQQATATLKVTGVKDANGNTIADATNTVNFLDTTVPSATSVTVTGPTSARVVFSEPVTGTVLPSSFSLDNNTYSISTATPVVGQPNAIDLTFGSVLPTGSHDLKVNPTGTLTANLVKDYANFAVPTSDVTFNYATDATAPTVSLVSASQNQVVLKFSKPITNTGSVSVYQSYNNVANYQGSYSWAADNQTLTVTFNGTPLPLGNVTLYVDNATTTQATDAWGNVFANATLTAAVAADTTAPVVSSVTQVDGNNIDVTFSKAVTGANVVSNYTLKDTTGTVVAINSVAQQGTTNTYRLNTASLATGGAYSLSIAANAIKDTTYNQNVMAAYAGTVNVVDKVAPTVTATGTFSTDKTKAMVSFSEAMSNTALDPANYMVSFDGVAADATALPTGTTLAWGSDNKSVVITFPAAESGLTNTVSTVYVAQVADVAGNKTASFQNTVTLSTDNITATNIVANSVKATAVDTIQFQVNTALSAINVAGFTINGQTATSASYVNNGGVATVTVKAPTAGKFASDLSNLATNNIVVASGAMTSSFGTTTGGFNVTGAADYVAPTVSSIATVDANHDGYVDGVDVTFSENLYVASVTTNTFKVDGYTVTGVQVDPSSNNVVHLVVTPNTVFDTNATPNVTLAAAVSDASVQHNTLAPQVAVAATDAAKPELETAKITTAGTTAGWGNDVNDVLTLTYSEPVQLVVADTTNHTLTAAELNALLGTSNIAYATSGTTVVTASVSGNQVTLTVTGAPFSAGAVISAATVGGLNTVLKDTATVPNTAGANTVAVQ